MTINLHKLGFPSEFWKYFIKITKIPHCSGNEHQIREFLIKEAEKFDYEKKTDKAGNLLVIIPPNKEKKSNVILQSHMDMVCEKNKDTEHDFSKDPLKLKIITLDNKKWITAEGTTLGADNATGMAYSLAIMEKVHKGELNFKNLEINLLFTVGEELGMFGALQIDKAMIRSNTLINLDSLRENVITIGCAGVIMTFLETRIDLIKINPVKQNLLLLNIKVTGLLGGHSGVDIHRGHANAIKIIAKILWELNKRFLIYILSIEGGDKNRNAIPREAMANLYIKNEEFLKVQNFLDQFILKIKTELSKIERDIKILYRQNDNFYENSVFSKEFQNKFLDILKSFPHGPIVMHPQIENLVHTSTNLACITNKKTRIKIDTMQRSFEKSSYKEILEKMVNLFKQAHLEIKFRQTGGFGEWDPNFKSPLLKLTKKTYEELYNGKIIITAVHGGLEPGIFKLNYPDLDMLTIGPNLDALHSPDERLDIQSVEKFWYILINLLKKL